MKRTIFTALSIMIALALLLTGCSGGVDTDHAKIDIVNFLEAIERDNYNEAESLLHPSNALDIKKFINNIEYAKNVDFNDGVVVKSYSNIEYSYYSSDVDGSRCEFTVDMIIGNKPVVIVIEVVSNDDGYGIYSVELDR